MEKPCVYAILDTCSGMAYVGSTQEFDKRIERHMRELRSNVHHNSILQKLWNDGNCNFEIITTEMDTREDAYLFEETMIQFLRNEGILTNVGNSSRGGDNLTFNPDRQKIIEKISQAGRQFSSSLTREERKETYGRPGEQNGMYGRTHSDEVKEKLSLLNKGNSYATGRVASQETRANLSAIASQRVGTKNPFYGKKHSEETKSKLSAANKGKAPPNKNAIRINGVEYESQSAAAEVLGVSPATITHRLKSDNPKFREYQIV